MIGYKIALGTFIDCIKDLIAISEINIYYSSLNVTSIVFCNKLNAFEEELSSKYIKNK